jgi:predicted N-acetyltransferase YhbS
MQVIELDDVPGGAWAELEGGEPEAWGGAGEALEWSRKEHHFAIREEDGGGMLALASVTRALIRVDGRELAVTGIGSVIVTPRMRGRGLARAVFERALGCAEAMEAEFVMLFCMPEKVALYEKFGFVLLPDRATAEQPRGRIEVPMHLMWLALTPGAQFPPGRVELLGLPF